MSTAVRDRFRRLLTSKDRSKFYFALLAALLIFLNFLTLLSALPATSGSYVGCYESVGCIRYSRDFSAYYQAAINFLTNPSIVYHRANNLTGNYHVSPSPQNYRYSPFFLLFVLPFETVNYREAMLAFDLVQFAMLPLLAYLTYEIIRVLPFAQPAKGEGGRTKFRSTKAIWVALSTFLFLEVLLQPFSYSLSSFHFWSWSYYWLWAEGQSRVIQTFFLFLCFYLILRRSRFAGLALILSSFDPRITLMALPLATYLAWKAGVLRTLFASSLLSIGLLYVPTLFYGNLDVQFFHSIFEYNNWPIYEYEWIPVLAIASLTVYTFFRELISHELLQREPHTLQKKSINIEPMLP